MGKVSPYHTNSTEYPPQHRNVHHDHDDCHHERHCGCECDPPYPPFPPYPPYPPFPPYPPYPGGWGGHWPAHHPAPHHEAPPPPPVVSQQPPPVRIADRPERNDEIE